ncbi:hypothetical protein BSR29_06360 [Boudabousia liubingyangii]|uniref:ATP/GTP-binding protein n=1 Tax=Boudabousia liubingyangii TaxID=1921764 RepID=A0A1Q5PKT1_9ACTO|nr:hypothetical protein BSR29_06360 [Boudabousia liubingyangii]
MSPRRSNKRNQARHVPLNMARLGSVPRTVTRRGVTYSVRQVFSGQKDYICPGCGQTVFQGNPHVVVWSEGSIMGPAQDLAGRRHWHSSCWDRNLPPVA